MYYHSYYITQKAFPDIGTAGWAVKPRKCHCFTFRNGRTELLQSFEAKLKQPFNILYILDPNFLGIPFTQKILGRNKNTFFKIDLDPFSLNSCCINFQPATLPDSVGVIWLDFQSDQFLSLETASKNLSFGEKDICVTVRLWKGKLCNCFQVVVLHKIMAAYSFLEACKTKKRQYWKQADTILKKDQRPHWNYSSPSVLNHNSH